MKTCSAVGRRALLGLAAGLAALPAAQARDRAAAPRRAVAIAGEALAVETLMGEGVDPHLFRPTRADIARLLGADAVFAIGHRLEGRMGDVFERLRAAGRPVLAVAEALPRERLRAHPDYADSADPHIWMDPVLWAEAAGPVAEAVLRLAPEADEAVRDRLAAFRARLARLDAYAREAVATIPEGQRLLVTAHDAFGYFAARYGLEGLSTEAEASLAHVERLVALLVARRVPAVFPETSVPDRAVLALVEGARARGHRVALGGALFSDALGRPGTYEGTYEGMLDHNITTIVRALGGRVPAGGLNGRLAA